MECSLAVGGRAGVTGPVVRILRYFELHATLGDD